jgi:endonuclease G
MFAVAEWICEVESVERASGLVLFSDGIKSMSKRICQTTECQVIIRHFDDAQKKVAAPKGPR